MLGCVFTSAGVVAYMCLYFTEVWIAEPQRLKSVADNQEKERWGLCRDAKRAASLAKLANRSVQTCWCSHLPSWGCGNEHLYGRRTGFISVDGQGGPPPGFAIGLICACQCSSPWNRSPDAQTRSGARRPVLWGVERRRPHGTSHGDSAGAATASRHKTSKESQPDFVQDFAPRNPYIVLGLKQLPHYDLCVAINAICAPQWQ